MRSHFSFGKTGIDVSVPERFRSREIRSHGAEAVEDETAAVFAVIDHPIGCAPLAALAAGKRTAAISVCDITRPAPNRITLPPVLTRLHEAGISAENITILIATGLHRAATAEEVNVIVGREIAAKYKVISHDAKALREHRNLGTTGGGIPVYIDERFVAADLHITLGFIEQHLMLGFSGGRKMIAPGLAAQETIKEIHSPRFMREALATEGSIRGNPLHGELLEIARMARHDFALDVTLTQERKISGAFAGDPEKAHAAGVEFLENTYLETLHEPLDAVITSAAGYPLDLTFYQMVKGVTAASHVVKPGGRILIVAECSEGVGSPEFAGKLKHMKSFGSFLEEIRSAAVEVDQWQLEKLALAGQRFKLFFYTPGISKSEMGFLGTMAYDDLDQAVAAALEGLPERASVALIPEGPYTFVKAEDVAAVR